MNCFNTALLILLVVAQQFTATGVAAFVHPTTLPQQTQNIERKHEINIFSQIPLKTFRIKHDFLMSSKDNAEMKSPNENNKSKYDMEDSYDVIIVGSGIGGLTTGAMLSLYGYKVAVLESHYLYGGCAHGFSTTASVFNEKTGSNDKLTFQFDTGPSFFSGLNPNIPAKSSNPLRTVLDAIDEQVECIPYTTFGLNFPEGNFIHDPNFGKKGGVLDKLYNSDPDAENNNNKKWKAMKEWERLQKNMEPLAKAVDAMPTAALRADIGALLTAGPFLPNFAFINPLDTSKLTTPFSTVIQKSSVENEFIQNWMDLLCFCLSGLPANGTITAEMAMMMGEFYDKDAVMDCPKGGANAIVTALVNGIEKLGGHVFVNSHVDQIVIEDGKATGVKMKKNNKFIQAKKAVVSNLSVWDMFSQQNSVNDNSRILDISLFPSKFIEERSQTPKGKSFMHLHIAFKATREELAKLQAHYIYIEDWERGVQAEDNTALLSIPSVHDDTLAPEGYAVLHIYTPATEDYEKWEKYKNDRRSEGYKALKKERSQFLFKALDKILPEDFCIQDRAVLTQIGTPLTHARFLRRHQGSYGPAIIAGEQSFPFPTTPIDGLLLCGDSCFPGIGVPAVAGSGLLAANSVSFDSIPGQLKLLQKIKTQ